MDLEAVAFGVANAGACVLAEAMANGTFSAQKVNDVSQSLIEVIRERTGVSIAEAEAACTRACAKLNDKDCN